MSDNIPTLKGVKRDRTGSRYARRARQQGLTPAVLYGHGAEPIAVAVPTDETLHHVQHGEKVFTLEVDGETVDTCLIKAMQYDHLGTDIVHLDLARVSLDERVEVHVPIHFLGDPVGLKEAGAVLEKLTTSITIECKVTNIPEAIFLDISGLECGNAIHAGELELPGAEMVLMSEAEEVIARVDIRQRILDAIAEDEAAAEEAALEGEDAPAAEADTEDGGEDEEKEEA
jgi:large subunit ribosomal protein L25